MSTRSHSPGNGCIRHNVAPWDILSGRNPTALSNNRLLLQYSSVISVLFLNTLGLFLAKSLVPEHASIWPGGDW